MRMRLLPMIVALPETEEQVRRILKTCAQMRIPVVPRGAGTGLSGGERRLVILAPMLAAVAAGCDRFPAEAARLCALDEIPSDLTDREADEARPMPGAIRATTWASTRTEAPVLDFRLGEDVAHPAFGEGVVTGVEPGGIVVIRFAKDGSERKLMAEYAPLSRR